MFTLPNKTEYELKNNLLLEHLLDENDNVIETHEFDISELVYDHNACERLRSGSSKKLVGRGMIAFNQNWLIKHKEREIEIIKNMNSYDGDAECLKRLEELRKELEGNQ